MKNINSENLLELGFERQRDFVWTKGDFQIGLNGDDFIKNTMSIRKGRGELDTVATIEDIENFMKEHE